MAQDRFEELLGMLLDDDIAVEQIDELVEIGTADPQKLDELREHLNLSDRLSQYEDELRSEQRFLDALKTRVDAADDTEDFVGKVVASARKGPSGTQSTIRSVSIDSQKTNRGFAGWIAATVALLVIVGLLVKQSFDGRVDDSDSQIVGEDIVNPADESDRGVAVLTRVSGLEGPETAEWRVGGTLPPGMMKWDAGLVQLEFYCGATVVVEGPASIDILDESRVVCRSGRLRAHVPEPARGFAVLAPTVELVDLGTEFGMEVTEDGPTEVHVFDGKVELYDAKSNRDVSTRRELNAGDALTVARDGQSAEIATRDADFVTPTRLGTMTDARREQRLDGWRAFRDSLRDDPRVVAYFPFDRDAERDRVLTGYSGNGDKLEGAIVGCQWAEGRWSGKSSLEFKRPGDRVRIHIPGEFESMTYCTWLRVDGLDRKFNSLLLTDGFHVNSPHWQIRQDGPLILGIRHPDTEKHDYQSDSEFNLSRLGQWVHLATVYDSDRMRVTHYVNGQIATREPIQDAASGLLQIGSATIGNWGLSSEQRPGSQIRNLNGRMDELIVFGQALDDADVRRIHEAGRP